MRGFFQWDLLALHVQCGILYMSAREKQGEQMTTGKTFISTEKYAKTVAKFDAINARAAKKGIPGEITITRLSGILTSTQQHGYDMVEVRGYDVKISGNVAIDGWEPVAKAEAFAGADDMVISHIDPTDATEYEWRKGECDHCHTRRGNRRHHYILRSETTGELIQVGRSCVKDFFGHSTTPAIIDGFFRGTGERYDPDMFDVVALSYAVIAREGEYRNAASEFPTARTVNAYLWDYAPIDDLRPYLADAETQAERAIEWVLSTDDYGYLGSLRALAQASIVSGKHFNLAASLPVAYQRYLDDEPQRRADAEEQAAADAKKSLSSHVGTVGEKITVTGVVETRRTIDTNFGYTNLVVLRCGDDAVKMFSNAKCVSSLSEGDETTLTVTVKEHSEWDGELQTMVNRPKAAK